MRSSFQKYLTALVVSMVLPLSSSHEVQASSKAQDGARKAKAMVKTKAKTAIFRNGSYGLSFKDHKGGYSVYIHSPQRNAPAIDSDLATNRSTGMTVRRYSVALDGTTKLEAIFGTNKGRYFEEHIEGNQKKTYIQDSSDKWEKNRRGRVETIRGIRITQNLSTGKVVEKANDIFKVGRTELGNFWAMKGKMMKSLPDSAHLLDSRNFFSRLNLTILKPLNNINKKLYEYSGTRPLRYPKNLANNH